MSISDFASAAQIGLPQVASPTAVGSLASTARSAARAIDKPFRKLGLAMRFKVVVEGLPESSLGLWTSCEGLKVEFKFDAIRSGGDYTNTHVLPTYVNYSPITLKRAVEHPHSDTVQTWLRQTAAQWQGDGSAAVVGKIVTIALLDVTQDDKAPAAYWTLANAFPVSWTGPSLSAKSSEIATETLVLEHDGFLAPLP